MKFLLVLLLAAFASAADPLNVYFIDVEGGQATLFVTPSGQSMLIDAGWNERDAVRIEKAIHAAGLKRLDYLVLTHYHRDHAGGVPPLVKRVPVGTFLDHGATTDHSPGGGEIMSAYLKSTAGGKRRAAHPGDRIALGEVQVDVVTANGKNLGTPLKEGGRPNALCGTEMPQADEKTENAQSLGVVVTFGNFRLLDLGDILWNQELNLVCPADPIGPVDVYVVTHHGKFTSGPATLVHSAAPRAAIMNNATDKGGSPETFRILKSSPGLRHIWQLHTSVEAGALNSAEERIANPQKDCAGFGLHLAASSDGSFQITNQRTGRDERYAARR